MSLKKSLLLKKSYKIRKILDILINCSFVVVVHVEKYGSLEMENFKRKLRDLKLNFYLINKDDVSRMDLFSAAKGPSLLIYSKDQIFFEKLRFEMQTLKIEENFLLIKCYNFISKNFFFENLVKKYNTNLVKVQHFLIFLMFFYKNFLYIFKMILINKLISLLSILNYNQVIFLFLVNKFVIDKK